MNVSLENSLPYGNPWNHKKMGGAVWCHEEGGDLNFSTSNLPTKVGTWEISANDPKVPQTHQFDRSNSKRVTQMKFNIHKIARFEGEIIFQSIFFGYVPFQGRKTS